MSQTCDAYIILISNAAESSTDDNIVHGASSYANITEPCLWWTCRLAHNSHNGFETTATTSSGTKLFPRIQGRWTIDTATCGAETAPDTKRPHTCVDLHARDRFTVATCSVTPDVTCLF